MTTFAHIGGGIAVAATIQNFIIKEDITPATLLAGALFGLLPDIDSIFALLFDRWTLGSQMLSHHRYFTHTPLFYLIVSSIIWLIFDWKWAIIFLVITLTHLLMDSWSTDDGIMWLWPLRTEQFSIYSMNAHAGGIYGVQFYARYIRTPRLILPEVIIILSGVLTIFWFVVQRYFSTK